ncbi:MAG: hypothetical protein HW421_4003 [Ignavibacteria bacterium]|nr:hypothetical protein [Ignavibacteria bacterium]
MQFYENEYYHLYNRTNNDEALFRSRENYSYFLKKYRYFLDDLFDTIAYCLMPTHFHFLVRVKERSKTDVQHHQEKDVQHHQEKDVQHHQEKDVQIRKKMSNIIRKKMSNIIRKKMSNIW